MILKLAHLSGKPVHSSGEAMLSLLPSFPARTFHLLLGGGATGHGPKPGFLLVGLPSSRSAEERGCGGAGGALSRAGSSEPAGLPRPLQGSFFWKSERRSTCDADRVAKGIKKEQRKTARRASQLSPRYHLRVPGRRLFPPPRKISLGKQSLNSEFLLFLSTPCDRIFPYRFEPRAFPRSTGPSQVRRSCPAGSCPHSGDGSRPAPAAPRLSPRRFSAAG